MFANLIESTSHQKELARKGRFFLITLISYALIVACAGLASIYAFDARLEENQDLEFLGLVPPIVPDKVEPAARREDQRPSRSGRQNNAIPQRTVAIDHIASSTKPPETVSADKLSVPEIPHGLYTIGSSNTNPIGGGPVSNSGPDGGGNSQSLVKIDSTPPIPKVEPVEKAKDKVLFKSHVLNGEAESLPVPPYPQMAKTAGIQGPVNVQIMIDEVGKIVSARATSGNPLLQRAAEQAAYRARFKPTLLNGVPVKVSGVITYNFSLR